MKLRNLFIPLITLCSMAPACFGVEVAGAASVKVSVYPIVAADCSVCLSICSNCKKRA